MLPGAKTYYVQSQSAISIRASAEDIALARKMLSDLDKTKKIYRLTYTMTEKDGGKTIGVQHFSIIVASGSMSVLKQGSRVPVGTNTSSAGSNDVTYLDLGQEIQASLDGYLDGVRLRTKVVQSGIAEDKSAVGTQVPSSGRLRLREPRPWSRANRWYLDHWMFPGVRGTRRLRSFQNSFASYPAIARTSTSFRSRALYKYEQRFPLWLSWISSPEEIDESVPRESPLVDEHTGSGIVHNASCVMLGQSQLYLEAQSLVT